MGKIFSSNKDFNRVLATQPRTSISLPKFEPPRNSQQQPRPDSFLIPTPMRISQTKNQSKNATSILPNESPIPNEYFKPTEKLIPSSSSSSIERTNLSNVINNQTRQKIKKEQPQQQIIARRTSSSPRSSSDWKNSSLTSKKHHKSGSESEGKKHRIRGRPRTAHSVRSNLPKHQQTIKGDAVVISRSAINRNDQRRTRNHFSSSFRSFYTVVERNGKQFLVEFKERTERRYVQCIDETTHQMRFFEVIDYIPCTIIRPYKDKFQSLSQNDTSQNPFLPTLRLNQRPALPPIPNDRSDQRPARPPISNDRSETVTPSDSIDNRGLNNRVNVAGEHVLQHNNVNVPLTNKTPKKSQYVSPTDIFSSESAPIPRLPTKNAADLFYQHSQPSSVQFLSVDSKNISDQYSSELFFKQPSLFRAYTSTISDDSAFSSTSNSFDEETEMEDNEITARILGSNESLIGYEQMNSSPFNNRNNTVVSYRTNDGDNSSTSLDPFARPFNSSDRHHYRKRSTIENYAEPRMNSPKFQQSAYPDSAPIPIAIK